MKKTGLLIVQCSLCLLVIASSLVVRCRQEKEEVAAGAFYGRVSRENNSFSELAERLYKHYSYE